MPAAMIGAAARLDAEAAAHRALEESAQPFTWDLFRDGYRDFTPGEDYANVIGFRERVVLFAQPDSLSQLGFLLETPSSRSIGDMRNRKEHDPGDELRQCLSGIAGKGMNVLVVDIATREIRERGFYVVKVLVPGLQPVNSAYGTRYLGGRRIYSVPKILGYTSEETVEDELNPFPHPSP
jgi:ribosomal protein S12 methylthiotransferase accessory factor